MKSVQFLLELETPLACSPEDSYYQAKFILPGSMLRGALASLYIRTQGRDELFERIFFTSQNRFPYLFLADEDNEPVPVASRVVAACKRQDIKHSVISRINGLMKQEKTDQCERCHQDMKAFSGYLTTSKLMQKNYIGHTAIGATTKTALPHAYHRELLLLPVEEKSKPQFSGYGYLDQESFETLAAMCDSNTLLIGKARSRGKGWAKLTLVEKKQEIKRATLDNQDDLFTLHCVSPVILLDQWLRPTTTITLKANEELQPKAYEVATNSIRGWNLPHGLPKIEDVAIELGSVYIYQKNDYLKNPDNFAKFIKTIEEKGIGERKIEGFGQVVINDRALISPKEVIKHA